MTFSILHWLIVLAITLPLYFLPSIIAAARNHEQKVLIVIVNLLTGWSGIGWIGCLVWSLVGKPAGGLR